MFKIFKISFLSIALLTNFIIGAIDNKNTVEAVKPSVEKTDSDVQQSQKVNLVPLTKEESEKLLENLTDQEKALLNEFLVALSKKLESLKEEKIVTDMAEVFSAMGISWNVTLSVYPCKQELNLDDSIENNMLLDK